MTIRAQKSDGTWKHLPCTVVESSRDSATIRVPEYGEWLISRVGMVANVGGNDWCIYTLHPDDCAAICDAIGGPQGGPEPKEY